MPIGLMKQLPRASAADEAILARRFVMSRKFLFPGCEKKASTRVERRSRRRRGNVLNPLTVGIGAMSHRPYATCFEEWLFDA